MKKSTCLWIFLLLNACQPRPEPFKASRHYAVSAKVVALDAQHRTATLDAAAIPNYMEAMTMDYPISSASDFGKLHVGDRISGTLDVADDDRYSLSSVKVLAPNAK